MGSLNPLGLQEAVEIHPEIYPNPAHNEITITYNSVQQPMQLELFDVTGRKEFFKSLPTGKNKELVILPSQLSEGVYQYRFSSSDKMIRTGKLEVRK